VNARDNNNWTPLHSAISHNPNAEVMKYLISQVANVNAKNHGGTTSLHSAAFNRSVEILEVLVSQGADVNAKMSPQRVTSTNSNVKELVSGAKGLVSDVDGYAYNHIAFGSTALHVAARNNPSIEVLAYLISKGAIVDARDDNGRTPLDVANTEEKREILRTTGGRSGQ
jgi:ankyrin repeat protein